MFICLCKIITYINRPFLIRKQLWASGECIRFALHTFRVQDLVGMVLSTELPPDYHQFSIKLSIGWCVWKVGEAFTGRVLPKTLEWVAVYSSVTFQINGQHSDRSALCLYTVTGWGVMSCVCGMAFLCGSTLVKLSLLQTGTVAI